MVHAYREGMKGVIYSESSELAVIAVSNIYISETRGPGEPLRRDHSDNSPPLDEQSFIRSNQDFIRSVKASDPIFFKKLGDVSAAFNPFFESTVTLTMGTPKIFQTHVIKAGDTLSDLAAKYYGAREYWPLIWDANRGAVPNPNLIEPGHPLRIAPLESLSPAELEGAKRRHASWKKHTHGSKAKVPVAPIR